MEKPPGRLYFQPCRCVDVLCAAGPIFPSGPLRYRLEQGVLEGPVCSDTLEACDLDILAAWMGPAATPGDRDHRRGALGGPHRAGRCSGFGFYSVGHSS